LFKKIAAADEMSLGLLRWCLPCILSKCPWYWFCAFSFQRSFL